MSQPTDEAIAAAVAELQASGQPLGKIAVIKGLRARTSLGLKAAKDAVEDYGRRHGIESLVKADTSGVGCIFVLAALGLVALGIALTVRLLQGG